MKHFAKTAVAAALTMAFAAPSFAVAPVTVYGKVNVTVGSEKVDGGDNKVVVKSRASRLGVKGGVELTESLEAIYKIEMEVNATDQKHSKSSEDFIKSRNVYAGLKGSFGEAVVGRNDTILKQSQGKVDLFNDLDGDIKSLFKGENRIGDTVTYKTPKFSGFQAGVTWVTEDSEKTVEKDDGSYKNGASLGAWYGDAGLKKMPFYAGVAYDSNIAGYKSVVRGSAYGKFSIVQIGGMIQQQKKDGEGQDNKLGWMVNAAVSATKELKFKVQYQDMEDLGSAASIGADYKLGKPTKVYAYYTQQDFEAQSDKNNYFAVGLEHKF